MESPARRMTRSQMSGLNPSSAAKPGGRPGPGSSTKKKELPRHPFKDLTNDSPISGLMPAKMTASAASVYESTPRMKLRPSERAIGEDLLRMQVTSLLRKVELDANLFRSQHGGAACAPPEFADSPVPFCGPTPANTPATAVPPPPPPSSGANQPGILPAIKISPPVCNLDAFLDLNRRSPAFAPTAELLSAIDEISPKSNASGAVNGLEAPTTRALRFDSPEKRVPANQAAPPAAVVETSSTASVSMTAEISSTVHEHSGSDAVEVKVVIDGLSSKPRAIQFDSPSKQTHSAVRFFETPPRGKDLETGLFFCAGGGNNRSPAARSETDDEDAWSVIVNVHSPEKTIDGPDGLSDEDVGTMQFVQSVLVDPTEDHRIEMPALWARRDTPARPKSSGLALEDEDDDDEDAVEEEDKDGDDDYEDEAAQDEEDEAGNLGQLADECAELCKGMSHISVGDGGFGPAEFRGKHIRFNYTSDDEMVEEVVTDLTGAISPGKTRLKGLPTPRGQHLRFADDDEDNEAEAEAEAATDDNSHSSPK